jgi:hypothetical protein
MDELQTRPPKKSKTWLIVIASVFGFLIVVIGLFLWWVFGGSIGNPNKSANEFLSNLETNQVDQAYAQTATIFKEATSREDFQAFVEAFPILTTSNEVSFDEIERSTADGQNVSVVSGKLTAESGETTPVEITMVAEDGVWKVATIDLRAPAERELTDSNSSLEEKIDDAANEVLKGKVADDKSKFIRTVVNGDVESGLDVIVEFNASSFGNRYDLKILEIESDMTNAYKALYTASFPINSVLINAFCSFVDEFGNDNDERCYSTVIEKDVAEKINWDQDNAVLSRQTVPGLWTLHFIDPEFQKEIDKVDN